jgi:hypothetical protein
MRGNADFTEAMMFSFRFLSHRRIAVSCEAASEVPCRGAAVGVPVATPFHCGAQVQAARRSVQGTGGLWSPFVGGGSQGSCGDGPYGFLESSKLLLPAAARDVGLNRRRRRSVEHANDPPKFHVKRPGGRPITVAKDSPQKVQRQPQPRSQIGGRLPTP